jgi:hypothetical protein
LGANKPNQFFNTHPRVYEKVNVSMNMTLPEGTANAGKKDYNSRALQDSQVNTAPMTAGSLNKQAATSGSGTNAKAIVNYNSVSTIEHGSSTHDPSSRSLMEMS